MKYFSIIAMIVLYFLNSVNAQDNIQKNKIYRTWITFNNKPLQTEGVLYEIKDSSILVSSSVAIKDYSTDRVETLKFNINEIETIKIRRKNSVGRGILTGAITGFAVGGLIGLISGDDPPCPQGTWFCFRLTAGEKALITGIPFSIGGAGIGALVGSVKVNIPINGSIDNYNKNKNELLKYSIKQ
ncbi:hypothetical protein ACFS7Z_00135 [Pontibacter toksunensis]|uniref:Uncharacterized protein n=1 Tax=Pontibacter toksunensis TaxID=1332631 RepID=A0ABW6BLJ5_9BACT